VQGAAKTCANSGGNAPATALKLKFFLSGGDAAQDDGERKDSEGGAVGNTMRNTRFRFQFVSQ